MANLLLTTAAYVLGVVYLLACLVALVQLVRIHYVAKSWTSQKVLHAVIAATALGACRPVCSGERCEAACVPWRTAALPHVKSPQCAAPSSLTR